MQKASSSTIESMSYFIGEDPKEVRVFVSDPADYEEQEVQIVLEGESLTFNFFCAGERTASMTKTFDELFEEAHFDFKRN